MTACCLISINLIFKRLPKDMHILIPYWHKCNNRCVMCTNPVDGSVEGVYFDIASLRGFVKKNKKNKRWIKKVYITGGETTIRPDFFESLRYIVKSFPYAKISILSNGRRFFYPDFTKKCLAYSSINFIIPIHGWDSESHDKITGIKGSFNQTSKGLENLFAMRHLSQQIEIRIIIHKINYKKIDKILNLIAKKFPATDNVVLVFIEYEGHAISNFKLVELSYAKFFPQFKKLEKYLDKFKEIRFYHFPLCVLPEKFWPYMWRTVEKDEITFLLKCDKCEVKKFCLGIYKKYLDLFGAGEFKIVKKTSNLVENKDNTVFNPIRSV